MSTLKVNTIQNTSGTVQPFGITHCSAWYVTSAFTGGTGTITSNWAQDTNANAGTIGTIPTQSSGVFTLPATGIWLIDVVGGFEYDGKSRYNRVEIETTANNSSYSKALGPYTFITDSGFSGAGYAMNSTQHMFDCTDTSNCKVRFAYETVSSVSIYQVNAKITRLGNT